MPGGWILLPEGINREIFINGIGALSALGHDPKAHRVAILNGGSGLAPLAKLLGEESEFAALSAGWIQPREMLTNRKWSPATMAALHVAKTALEESGWSAEERENAGLVVGTSRGNAAGWLGEWPGRRAFSLMAASNTIHSEPATAISIAHGIFGENHVVASGCSAGLDALGIADLLIRSGRAERVLVVAVDLPLVPMLLANYRASGLLGSGNSLSPFSGEIDGFLPGEGAAAIAVSGVDRGNLELSFFGNNSDGAHPVGVPKNGGRSSKLIDQAISATDFPAAICPHATGTRVQQRAEISIYEKYRKDADLTFHLLKPYVGHTIGASGLLEAAILLEFMKHSQLPPNLSAGAAGLDMEFPEKVTELSGLVYKLAHGMGGHNALAVFNKAKD